MARDYYETLGVEPERRRRDDQEGVPEAGARAAPGRQRARPRRRGEVQGGRGGLRGAERPGAAPAVRLLRGGRAARARLRARHGRVRLGLRPVLGVLRRAAAGSTCVRRWGRRPARARRRDAGRRRGRDRVDRPRRVGARQDGRDRLRGGDDVPALQRQRRRAGHADRRVRDVRRHRPAPARGADGVRPAGADRGVRGVRRATAGSRRRRARSATARAWWPSSAAWRSTSRPGSPTGSGSGSRGGATRASTAGPRATSTWSCGWREDERFLRDAEDLVTVIDVPAPLAALGTTVQVPTSTATCRSRSPPGTQPGETIVMRGRGLPPLSRGRTGDLRVVVNVAIPRRLSREQRALLEELRRRSPRTTCAPTRACWPSSSGCSPGDRLAVRVPRAAAEIVLAELLELSPAGLEETDVERGRRRVRALRRGGRAAGPARAPGGGGGRAGRGLDHRGPRRLGRPLEGVAPAGRRRLALPAAAGAAAVGGGAGGRGRGSTSSSTPARRSGRARTTRRGCASSCCSSSTRAARWRTGARAAACSRSRRRGSATRRCWRSTSSRRRSRRRR